MSLRPHRRLVGAFLGGGVTVVLLLLPVSVRAAADSTTVLMRAESWYRPLPGLATGLPDTCNLPIGCAPSVPGPPVAPPSAYPEGFLHVGVGAGVEESRTYLGLDLNELPADVEFTGGTLTLPIATDPTAGVALPETSKVRACHVPTFVGDGVAGDLSNAPDPDCTITSPATYVAAAGEQPATLVVDLSPFVELWSAGVASVVLLPEEGIPPTETWHVAFSRRDRAAADAVPISALLEIDRGDDDIRPAADLDSDADSDLDPGVPAPLSLGGFDLPPVDDSASFGAPAIAPAVEPELTVNSGSTVATTEPLVTVIGGRYAYPAVLLLPLAVAAAIAWAGRAFTRDLSVEEG